MYDLHYIKINFLCVVVCGSIQEFLSYNFTCMQLHCLPSLEMYITLLRFIFRFNKDFVKAAVSSTNTNYGGLDIEVSRVVYVHGSVDPWHALGIIKTKDNDAPAIFIKGYFISYKIERSFVIKL